MNSTDDGLNPLAGSKPDSYGSLLLVEDEALIRMSLERAFIDAGYTVITASNGEAAIKQLDRADSNLIGLITDIRLGDGANGWDVGRHARKLNPTFSIVYITGDSAHAWALQGVHNSILVTKPFAETAVIAAMSNLLAATSNKHNG